MNIQELEIIKSALECDINHQKKTLEEMYAEGGSDIRFEMWLEDTEILYKKVVKKLSTMKAQKALIGGTNK